MKILFLYIYVLPRSRQVQMTREIAISNALLSTPTPRILISAPVITEKDTKQKMRKEEGFATHCIP